MTSVLEANCGTVSQDDARRSHGSISLSRKAVNFFAAGGNLFFHAVSFEGVSDAFDSTARPTRDNLPGSYHSPVAVPAKQQNALLPANHRRIVLPKDPIAAPLVD